MKQFSDDINYIQPTPSFSFRLEHDGVTKERQERVALLLKHVQEADVVYRVASQLGLRGTVDACLASSSAPYLRDTVFTKGFTYGS